jgi:CobQ-like glutamine amidotransferase family enzyme
MEKTNNIMELNIAHLYPELLNIYGDQGNVLALSKRCFWRGIKVNVFNINIGDNINPEFFDFYFIGGGQDKQQIIVSDELMRQKEALTVARDNMAVFLAICGGYQLLGHYYRPHNAEDIKGISLIDAYTIAGNSRFIGNVTIETDFLTPSSLVGFENHSGLTYLEGETKPLGTVKIGNGNNAKDKSEGAVYKNIFGTYLHGSLLPKNPHFTDHLIKLSLQRRYGNIELETLDDSIELLAHNKALGRKY